MPHRPLRQHDVLIVDDDATKNRCVLCEAILNPTAMVVAMTDPEDALCETCELQPVAERRRLRSLAMVRMLRRALAA